MAKSKRLQIEYFKIFLNQLKNILQQVKLELQKKSSILQLKEGAEAGQFWKTKEWFKKL